MVVRRTVHVSVKKRLLLDWLREHGATRVLVGWEGTTEEAIALIEAHPADAIVMDASCDNQVDGHCLGHVEIESEAAHG